MRERLNSLRQLAARNYLKAGVLVGASLPMLASAQDPSAFDEAISDATAAVGEYATALVGLAAVAVVFMIAIKYVKKIVSAA